MDRVIVIGCTHHNSLGVIRSLGERNYKVEFVNFSAAMSSDYVSVSKYIYLYKPLSCIEQVCQYLSHRPNLGNKEVIISCADIVTEYLNEHLEQLSDRYIIPGIPHKRKMVEMMKKTVMIEMASLRGISAPKVWHLNSERHKVTFPCITKCVVSSHGGKSDIRIHCSEYELDNFLLNCEGELFAQDFIEKKEEIQFIGCSLRGGEEVIIPGMSRIIRSQHNTNTGFLEYGPIGSFYNDIVEKAKLYIQDCQYSGLFSFEIIRDIKDNIWFLEMNFRNDGNAWSVTKSGINLPVIWVKACYGEDYWNEICSPKRILMMPEFQDFKLVLQGKVTLLNWFKDVMHTDYFMVYDKQDIKPFINKIWTCIKNLFVA